jgi:formiminotetrahydrofolate cyclodeaminase
MPDRTPTAVADRTIGQYLAALSSDAPMPGGGSAAGIVGALGAGLGLMAIALTDLDASDGAAALRASRTTLETRRDRLTALARQDEDAYLAYLDATALPKDTSEEKATRRLAMQVAMKQAASVPLTMATAAVELAEALVPVQQYGNKHLLSDARVGAIFASACFAAARVLVDTNLRLVKDPAWVGDTTYRLDALAQRLATATVTA